MGYINHHAIIVTCGDEKTARSVHAKARKLFNVKRLDDVPYLAHKGSLVSPLSRSVVNEYWSFAIFPDGSKEGWPLSKSGDDARAAFIAWCNATYRQIEDEEVVNGVIYDVSYMPFDVIEVSYDEANRNTIANHAAIHTTRRDQSAILSS